jgi:hypothetical protein
VLAQKPIGAHLHASDAEYCLERHRGELGANERCWPLATGGPLMSGCMALALGGDDSHSRQMQIDAVLPG